MQVQWVGKIHWRREWQSTAVLLPGESHRQRSLVGYSPWGHKEPDRLKRLSMHAYPGGKWQGKGTRENCSAKAHSLRFYVNGISFQSCLWSVILLVLTFGLTQGPFLSTCIFQPRWILAWGFLGGWLILWAGISSLILASPKFSWLVFHSNTGSTEFLIGWNLFCETAHSSSYYLTWLRWAVLVNSSLTVVLETVVILECSWEEVRWESFCSAVLAALYIATLTCAGDLLDFNSILTQFFF